MLIGAGVALLASLVAALIPARHTPAAGAPSASPAPQAARAA
ncbi:hypothetical protein [Streptomyces sp. NPDC085466]